MDYKEFKKLNMASIESDKDKIFEKIAKDILGIPTLKTRNSDSLDFHEVSVWSLKEALEEAYKQGSK